jgi:2-keto-4-pentenoate hydratase/2-oxohepta-3-ene-1,7-dioic acid hydratase in catechol pathway
MRIVAYDRGGEACLGVVEDGLVVELALVAPELPRDLAALLRMDNGLDTVRQAAWRARAAHRRPLDGLRYRLPIERPGKILCLGPNYAGTAAQWQSDVAEYPAAVMRAATSLTPHEGPIMRPRVSEQLDYGAELVVIVGRRARHLRAADALGCVAGYACFNDGTVRDYERHTQQWTIGKNFDATGAIGPWMVTADELPPGAAGLRIEANLCGEPLQCATTSDMIFPVAKAIALLTECMTLEPGDLIAMGSPPGVGSARHPRIWMRPGDVVEVAIEGIGTLRNPVLCEREATEAVERHAA